MAQNGRQFRLNPENYSSVMYEPKYNIGDVVLLNPVRFERIPTAKVIDRNFNEGLNVWVYSCDIYEDGKIIYTRSVVETDIKGIWKEDKKASGDTFEALTLSMIDVHKKKNHDYGNSFNETVDEFGLVAAVVRLNDKMKRIKALYDKVDEAEVEESLTDTLLDLANYAVMTAAYIKDNENEIEDE